MATIEFPFSEGLVEIATESQGVRPMPGKKYRGERYADYTFSDETSSFDPKGRWQGGSECYMRDYTCRVPKGMLARCEGSGDYSEIDDWISRNSENDIWVR